MPVGIVVNKSDLDFRTGVIAKNFQQMFQDAVKMNEYLLATPNVDLEALGYNAQEVATLKTAYADLAQLESIWRGASTVTPAKDFRTFVRRLWGFGSF
jgi:hypothetical protein